MSYLEKARETLYSTETATANFVGYVLPFYMKHLPERKSGTGDVQWDDLCPNQKELHTSLHPHICNAVYSHQQKILKANKLDTIIKLARVFDDKTLEKILTTLDITPDHILLQLK